MTSFVKKAVYAAAAMLGVAGAGTATQAEAQSYAGSSNATANLINAEQRLLRATLNSRVAQCNTRLYSGGRNAVGTAMARTSDARACRADAEADYYFAMGRFLNRYKIPNEQYMQQAFNSRAYANQLEYQADRTLCTTRFIQNLDRARSSNSRSRSRKDDNFFDKLNRNSQKMNRYGQASSQVDVCQARAQRTYAQNQLNLERSINRYLIRSR